MKDIVKFIIVLLIIIAIISILYTYSKEEESSTGLNDVAQNEKIENSEENVNTTNQKEKEQVNNKEDNVEEADEVTSNTENSETGNNQTTNEEVTTNSNPEQSVNNKELTDEEKAIKLVKEEYGVTDSSISYKIVNVDGKNYTISVSSTSTTEVIAWYTVNIETGKVTME